MRIYAEGRTGQEAEALADAVIAIVKKSLKFVFVTSCPGINLSLLMSYSRIAFTKFLLKIVNG